MISLQDFIQKWTGVANAGTTPENSGQCVGISELWIQNLGLERIWGNAKDLLINADPNNFDIIQNTPTGVPQAGDIMVWGDTWGNGNGHTGIFCSGDANSFNCFEQNDPVGSNPHAKTYTYSGVSGWLHPHTAIPVKNGTFVDSATFTKLVHNSEVTDLLNAYLSLPANSDWSVIRTKLDALTQNLTQCQTDLETAQTLDTEEKNKIDQLTKATNTLNEQIQALQNQVTTLQDQVSKLQVPPDGTNSPTSPITQPNGITTPSNYNPGWFRSILRYFGF